MDKYYTLSPCPIPFHHSYTITDPPHQFITNKHWVPLPKKPLAQIRSLVWLPNCVECRSGQGQCLGAGQVHQLRLVVYPIICRVLYIPDHPRWLALGFLNHQQYQFDQSNSSVQYIHFHSPEPSWYHWGGMRSCSSHIITSFLHFKLFDKHVLQNHRLFFPKPILPAKLCTEDNFPKQELPYKKHQKAPKDKSIHLCWASLERLRLLDAPVPQPTLHLLEFGKPSNNCPL